LQVGLSSHPQSIQRELRVDAAPLRAQPVSYTIGAGSSRSVFFDLAVNEKDLISFAAPK
jgi:hypothetical protein